MKIVVWNCNGAFRNKYHLLENMKADILVIQDCEDPSRSTLIANGLTNTCGRVRIKTKESEYSPEEAVSWSVWIGVMKGYSCSYLAE